MYCFAIAIRATFILYGLYQDNYELKFTDIDYIVFSDGARYFNYNLNNILFKILHVQTQVCLEHAISILTRNIPLFPDTLFSINSEYVDIGLGKGNYI